MSDKIKLKLIDVIEDGSMIEGLKRSFQSDNLFVIIMEIVKGADLIENELKKNLKPDESINKIFNDRGIRFVDEVNYLFECLDTEDAFIGSQEAFMECVANIILETEDILNRFFNGGLND
ncbi:MAG: hypothetical protein Q8M92_01160 [Candidatus Subteraquimicrobiales bacterium]|nr:hypothetical protein [Candidatus Subteraquimicrobiales bacterium]